VRGWLLLGNVKLALDVGCDMERFGFWLLEIWRARKIIVIAGIYICRFQGWNRECVLMHLWLSLDIEWILDCRPRKWEDFKSYLG
jgi:hypothetical protein